MSEIENHLELGREMLAKGQLSDALSHYHAAVEGDPNNYLTFFKRGTVFLALGKARFALQDFSKVLEIKPDFTSARMQRGSLYFKVGDYENALIDFERVLNDDPYNAVVNDQYNRIPAALDQWKVVKTREAMNDYQTVIHLVSQLLELSPMSIEFRKARANAFIKENDILSAISDLRSVNKLTQDSTDGYFQIAQLLYDIGHATSALKEIRECLKLDPENKNCFPLYKKTKEG
ncbi:DNAJC3 family protein [Megaselia abdita]